jgi:hypothetical protein
VPVDDSASYAGIGRTTFLRWCQTGRDVLAKVEEAAERGQEYEPDPYTEEPYYQLWLDIDSARAKAVVGSVLNVQRAAVGGFVTKEVTRRFRDPVTGQVVEETTVDKQPPDWRAASFLLTHGSSRAAWIKAPQAVEHTGAGGGPIEHTLVDAEALANRVQANMLAAREAQVAGALTSGEDEGVLEGEVVDG